jgi:Spy/CpxP family protein refolding chaperone
MFRLPTLRQSIFAATFMGIGALGTLSMHAVAGRGGPHGEQGQAGGRGEALRELVEEMNLSAEQKTQLMAIKDAAHEHRKSSRDDRQADLESLTALMAEEKLDRKAVHKELDARIKERAEGMHDLIDQIADFHATLNAEQRATLVAGLDELSERMAERGGRHGQGGPGGAGEDVVEGAGD